MNFFLRAPSPRRLISALVMQNSVSKSLLLAVAFESALIVSLSLPNFPYRGHVVLITLLSLAAAITYTALSDHHVHYTQVWRFVWVPWLVTIEKFLRKDQVPEAAFWRMSQQVKEALDMESLSVSKLAWSTSLIHNFRGIGWNWQVKNVPSQNETRRHMFVVKRLYRLLLLFSAFDFLQQIAFRLFAPGIGSVSPALVTIRHRDWIHGFVNALVFGLTTVIQFDLIYSAISILPVACGFHPPQDCHHDAFVRFAHKLTSFRAGHRYLEAYEMLTLYGDSGVNSGTN